MLRNLKDLEHYMVRATDGEIGRIADFCFEDDAWVVRYVVVETGARPSRRKVLISPLAAGRPVWLTLTMPVALTREEATAHPDVEIDPPVSRQSEEDVRGYCGESGPWTCGGMWGVGMSPCAMAGLDRVVREHEPEACLQAERARDRGDDPPLRSCNAVIRYRLRATDGDIGHVAGFLVDPATWAIRYLVVDTGRWWRGHEVLVAPSRIDRVNGCERSVEVALNRESIKRLPRHDPVVDWSREQDLRLYHQYGRGYWDGSQVTERAF